MSTNSNRENNCCQQKNPSSGRLDDEKDAKRQKTAAHAKKNTVCRFLVKDVRASSQWGWDDEPKKGGRARSDFAVDLLVGEHSLLDLVTTVFEIMREENLTDDRHYSHLWYFNLGGIKYASGWRSGHKHNSVSVENHLDEEEPRMLDSLAKPLAEGQKGGFNGESATFEVVVQSAALRDVDASEISNYPSFAPVEVGFSSDIKDDWLPQAAKKRCMDLRTEWEKYYSSNSDWKRDRKSPYGEYVKCKPQHPAWGGDEVDIMKLLICGKGKFKKCWNDILRYAFPDRSEGATSGTWYGVKKGTFGVCHETRGKRPTDEELIVLAKRLAKSHVEKMIEAGVPKRKPNPTKNTEDAMRREGKITDGMDPELKKVLIAQEHVFRKWRGDDSDDDSDNGGEVGVGVHLRL